LTTGRGNRLVRTLSWPLIRRSVSNHLSGVEGLEHVPTEGAFILAPNHTSYYDHFLITVVVRSLRTSPVWYLTKSEAFAGTTSRVWHEWWYSIPVDREGPTTDTLRSIRSTLAGGAALCIYPEGTRGPGDALLPFKDGPFRFGIMGNVPVIPVGIHGSNEVLPRGSTRTSRARARVVFGPPLRDGGVGSNPARAAVMRQEGAHVVGGLVARASATDCGHSTEHADAVAQVIGAQIGKFLDERGRLARRGRRTGPGSVELDVQQVRLAGLRATNAPLALRPILAAPVRSGARRVLRAQPDHPMANYLLGRWYLVMPRAFGGGARHAVEPLTRAKNSSPTSDTRALTALAEAELACGHPEAARSALLQVIAQTEEDGRGSARITRARQALVSRRLALTGSCR
jgi:1-acyl-sn-glycerol-3-phosphate acyltransferase